MGGRWAADSCPEPPWPERVGEAGRGGRAEEPGLGLHNQQSLIHMVLGSCGGDTAKPSPGWSVAPARGDYSWVRPPQVPACWAQQLPHPSLCPFPPLLACPSTSSPEAAPLHSSGLHPALLPPQYSLGPEEPLVSTPPQATAPAPELPGGPQGSPLSFPFPSSSFPSQTFTFSSLFYSPHSLL